MQTRSLAVATAFLMSLGFAASAQAPRTDMTFLLAASVPAKAPIWAASRGPTGVARILLQRWAQASALGVRTSAPPQKAALLPSMRVIASAKARGIAWKAV